MVSETALKKNALFLRSLSQTDDNQKLKTLLVTSANTSLKLLVLLVKDFIYKKIPIQLTDEEKKKLARYKNHIRTVASLGAKRTRWFFFIVLLFIFWLCNYTRSDFSLP